MKMKMKMQMQMTSKKTTANYYLSFLKKENDLNKILKLHRRDPSKIGILFVSLWDQISSTLIEKLKEAESGSSKKYPLYIVDSYNMPHSFVIYNATKVPTLVKLDRNKAVCEDYLPRIYDILSV